MKKSYLTLAIFSLMLCLALPTSGQGATIQYLGGEFTIRGAVSASLGADTTADSFGPISGVSVSGFKSVRRDASGGCRDNYASASAWVRASANTGGGGFGGEVDIQCGTINFDINDCPGSYPASTFAGGTVSTPTEILYRVIPEMGEHFGDQGTFGFMDESFLSTSSFGGISFKPASTAHISVTVNGIPIYSKDAGDYPVGFGGQESTFPIRIGDIIGLTMNWDMGLDHRYGFGHADFQFSHFLEGGLFDDFTPSPVPLPATLLCFGSGLVGLAAWKRFKMN